MVCNSVITQKYNEVDLRSDIAYCKNIVKGDLSGFSKSDLNVSKLLQ